MLQEMFLIKDIFDTIRVSETVEARDGFVKDKEGHNPLVFNSYGEAVNHLDELPDGFYKVEKVFRKYSK